MLSDFTQVQQVRNGKRLSYGHFSALKGHFSRSQVNRSVSNFQYSYFRFRSYHLCRKNENLALIDRCLASTTCKTAKTVTPGLLKL